MLKRNGNRLDVLIISHFDQDHVNGLRDLLRGVQVDVIVMPYLTPADRLLFAFGPGATPTRDYIEFLVSPTRYLQDAAQSVGQIVMVESVGENEDDGALGGQDLGPVGERELPGRDLKWRRLITGNSPQPSPVPQSTISERRFRGRATISYAGFWEFLFFNRAAWRGAVSTLQTAVQSEIDNYEARSPHTRDFGVLIEKLREIYRDPAQFGDGENGRNEISLITYTGPVGHSWIDRPGCRTYDTVVSPLYGSRVGYCGHNYGCLYTGDIIMRTALRVDLNNRLGTRRWGSIGVLQVPHHGADTAWRDAPPDGWQHRMSVFSYGLTNTYGHPGPRALAAMLSHSPVRVNESQGFFWFYDINWLTPGA